MKTVRIAAAQTAEFREDIDGALRCATEVAACAQAQGAALLCLPEGFLQGYLTEESAARRQALALASAAFDSVLQRLPRTGPMIVMGMIEMHAGRLFNTAVVVYRGALVMPVATARSSRSRASASESTSATTRIFRRLRAISPTAAPP